MPMAAMRDLKTEPLSVLIKIQRHFWKVLALRLNVSASLLSQKSCLSRHTKPCSSLTCKLMTTPAASMHADSLQKRISAGNHRRQSASASQAIRLPGILRQAESYLIPETNVKISMLEKLRITWPADIRQLSKLKLQTLSSASSSNGFFQEPAELPMPTFAQAAQPSSHAAQLSSPSGVVVNQSLTAHDACCSSRITVCSSSRSCIRCRYIRWG